MFRKIAMFCLLAPLMSLPVGCSHSNPPDGTNWDQVASVVEMVTEVSARIAFANDSVQPYKGDICKGVSYVAPVLSNFEDPDATFEEVRALVRKTIMELPPDVLGDELKPIVADVADQILNGVFMYVRDAYSDLVNQDQARIVLLVSRAVANGLTRACTDTQEVFATRLQGVAVQSSCSGCSSPCTK